MLVVLTVFIVLYYRTGCFPFSWNFCRLLSVWHESSTSLHWQHFTQWRLLRIPTYQCKLSTTASTSLLIRTPLHRWARVNSQFVFQWFFLFNRHPSSQVTAHTHTHTGSIIPILVLILSWRLVLLLPIRNYKTEEENPNDFEMRSNNEFSGSILPTNQMAMSMNAVASAPPMPIMHPGYVTGEGGLLYWEQNNLLWIHKRNYSTQWIKMFCAIIIH